MLLGNSTHTSLPDYGLHEHAHEVECKARNPRQSNDAGSTAAHRRLACPTASMDFTRRYYACSTPVLQYGHVVPEGQLAELYGAAGRAWR